MADPTEHLAHQERAAAKRLQEAAQWAQLHATAAPLFSKRMGRGKTAVIVRFEWPGVLIVADPDTGRILSQSEPGKPAVLATQQKT